MSRWAPLAAVIGLVVGGFIIGWAVGSGLASWRTVAVQLFIGLGSSLATQRLLLQRELP